VNGKKLTRITSITSIIFTIYIHFIQKYMLFRPLAHDKRLIQSYQTEKTKYSFDLLKHTLFSDCLLQISNICFDKSNKNSPSIENIMLELEGNDHIIEALKILYSNCKIGTLNDDCTVGHPYTNDEQQEKIRRNDEQQEKIRRSDFDEKHLSLKMHWGKLKESHISKKIKDLRNKVVAHRDIKDVNDNFELSIFGDYNITYREFEIFTEKVKEIMILLQALVRQSGFDYGSLDSFIEKNINGFWDK